MSDGVARLVDVLNAAEPAAVCDVVSPAFRDRDPLTVPGLLSPRLPGTGTRADLVEQVSFLARPGVDFRFHLESVRPRGALVDYRLYGDGLLAVDSSSAPAPAMTGSGKVLGGRLHVGYSCAGTFRVAAGWLVERWGRAVLS